MEYGKKFRNDFGFKSQNKLKKYFKATDIVIVNWQKIKNCNNRLIDISNKLNGTVHPSIKHKDISEIHNKITKAYTIMKENGIIEKLTNQGRTPDNVYYNWMRGYLISEFFVPSIAKLFEIPESSIKHIGNDDLKNIKTFKRAATADLEITTTDGQNIRLEIQSGFTGINDVKFSKLDEAKERFNLNRTLTYLIHFDIFNGLAAIIDISCVDKSKLNSRTAYENTIVCPLKEEHFRWKLAEPLLELGDYKTEL